MTEHDTPMMPYEAADGSTRLKTIRKGRDRRLVEAAMEVQQRTQAKRGKQLHLFSMEVKGVLGQVFPIFMTPCKGTIQEVQVRRDPTIQSSLGLEFEASAGGVDSSFKVSVPKGLKHKYEGAQLPKVLLPPMTAITILPKSTETFWLNVIFVEGKEAKDGGESADAGVSIPAGAEEGPPE